MFGAAAVRQKKRLKEQQIAAEGGPSSRGPYIKPFGPRFDPSELPYFKYKRALLEAQLAGSDSTISKASQSQQGRYYQGRGSKPDKVEEIGLNLKVETLELDDGIYRASSSSNIVLYVGLGMISIGLVITFVGLGDKGFRTLELKLIGPSLVGCGLFFALLRILFCTVPVCCKSYCRCCRTVDDKTDLIDQDIDSSPNKVPISISRNGDPMDSRFQSDMKRQLKDRNMSNHTKNYKVFSAKELSGEPRQMAIQSSQAPTSDANQVTSNPVGSVPTSTTRSVNQLRSRVVAKPLSYDNYSSDTSSQFSTDVIEVESAPDNVQDETAIKLNSKEVLLNAAELSVESET